MESGRVVHFAGRDSLSNQEDGRFVVPSRREDGKLAEKDGPVLVTGTSTGIARAITEMLSSRGHPVLAGARKEADLNELRRLPNATPIRLDVTREEDLHPMVQYIPESQNGLIRGFRSFRLQEPLLRESNALWPC